MPITLYESPSYLELAGQLAKILRPRMGPFETIHCLVPNRAMERFLEAQLSVHCDSVMNVRFARLEPFFRGLIEEEVLGLPNGPWVLPDRRYFESCLLYALKDPQFLERYPVFERYLDRAEGRDQKLVALSVRFGRLFFEYSLSLGPLIGHLLQDQLTPVDHLAPTQQQNSHDASGGQSWQLRCVAELLRRFPGPGRMRTFDQLIGGLVKAKVSTSRKPIIIFGYAFLEPVFHRVLERLAQSHDVTLFAWNPCLEYWQDAPNRSKVQRVKAQSDPSDDNVLLSLWGRPVGQHLSYLYELTEYESTSLVAHADGTDLLSRVKAGVLHRTKTIAADNQTEWPTLSFCQAPTVDRELEFLAATIWSWISRGSSVFSDVVLAVPKALWKPTLKKIEQVFSSAQIPFYAEDTGWVRPGSIYEVALSYVQVLASELSRPTVETFLCHPLTQDPSADFLPIAWCLDQLSAFADVPTSDKLAQHTDRLTQALNRIALGAVAEEPHLANNVDQQAGGQEALAHERLVDLGNFSTSDPVMPALLPFENRVTDDGLHRFAFRLLMLDAHAKEFFSKERTFSEFAELFWQQLKQYFGERVSSDDEQKVLSLVRSLARLDLEASVTATPIASEETLSSKRADTATNVVSGSIALAYIKGAISNAQSSSGDPAGVRVVPLEPMRILDAGLLLVCGLTESAFPQVDRSFGADLRSVERLNEFRQSFQAEVSSRTEINWPKLRGELNSLVRPEERDRLALLEALMVTREEAVISWAGLDRNHDPQRRSSAVDDLDRAVPLSEQDKTIKIQNSFARTPHRDDLYLSAFGAAGDDQQASELRPLLRGLVDPVLGEDLPVRTLGSQWEAALHMIPCPEAGPIAAPRVVTPAMLSDFVWSPAEAWAQHVLSMPLFWTMASQNKREPIEVPAPRAKSLLQAAFARCVLTGAEPRDVLLDLALAESQEGNLPAGAALTTWVSSATPKLRRVVDWALSTELGQEGVLTPVFAEHEITSAGENGSQRLEVTGPLPLHRANRLLLTFPKRGLARLKCDLLVSHLLLSLSDPGPRTVMAMMLGGSSPGVLEVTLRPFPKEIADEWLVRAALDLFTKPNWYYLPFDDMAKFDPQRHGGDEAGILLKQLEKSRGRDEWKSDGKTFRGFARKKEELPIPQDAYAIYLERHAPLLSSLVSVKRKLNLDEPLYGDDDDAG